MEHFLKQLITDGENLHLDFKYCVSDSRKIARISSYRAEAILANLIIFRVLIMKASEKGFTYELHPDEPAT